MSLSAVQVVVVLETAAVVVVVVPVYFLMKLVLPYQQHLLWLQLVLEE
jgi:hypothetical protein